MYSKMRKNQEKNSLGETPMKLYRPRHLDFPLG